MNARVDVLGNLDFHARRMARNCKFCPDPVCCTDCDVARPTVEARAAVAELIDAAAEILVTTDKFVHAPDSIEEHLRLWSSDKRLREILARIGAD